MLINLDDYNMADPIQIKKARLDYKIANMRKLIKFTQMQFEIFVEAALERATQDLENKDYQSHSVHMQEVEITQGSNRPLICQCMFVNSYSFIEVFLNELCDVHQERLKLKVRFSDINGQGIERAALYLLKVIGINIKQVSLWQKVRILGKLRNAFIHNEGVPITKEDKKLYEKYLEVYIDFDETAVHIEFDDCEKFLNIFQKFAEEIITLEAYSR